ncbi:MAG: methyltransferase family protein [Terriglobia bacterium]
MTLRMPIIRWGVANALLAGIAFLCAGSVAEPALRRYLLVYAVLDLVSTLVISPALSGERSQPLAEGIDPAVRPLGSLLFVATVASGAFDVGRIHWTCPFPRGVQDAALLALIGGNALQIWAMAVNAFFSTELRIQAESGHQLVRHGPYRYVRHPGYLAMLLIAPSTALTLGSKLALFPAAMYVALILFRVEREDRYLLSNLPGYADYIRGAPDRLIPGVW